MLHSSISLGPSPPEHREILRLFSFWQYPPAEEPRSLQRCQAIPPRNLMLLLVLAALGLNFTSTIVHAEPAQPDKEQRQWRILDSQAVNLGPRSIIYNRVETPVLKPQPVTVERTPALLADHIPTAEKLEEMRFWEALDYVGLFLSCTVYADQLTEVRFRQGESDIVFWSTINFNFLSQLFDLLTKDIYYSIFIAVGDSTTEEFNQQNAELLRMGRSDLLSTWPNDIQNSTGSAEKSAWRITSKDPVTPEVLRSIEDLHTHFDANRDALIAKYAEREAARIVHEQWLKDNPPQPKDTIVQFFPIQSDHSTTEAKTLESSRSTPREW